MKKFNIIGRNGIAVITCMTSLVFQTSGVAAMAGSSSGAFLRLGLGAERAAMGDCGAAAVGAGMNWYYNPASLPYLKYKQFTLGYRSMALDRSLMYVGFAMPLHPNTGNAGLAFGVMRAAVADIDGRDSNGERFDILSYSDNLIHGTFAIMLSRFLAAGVTIKWMIAVIPNIQFDDKNLYAYGMGIDFGLMYTPLPKLRFGAQVRDVNGKLSWEAKDVWGDPGGAKDDQFPTLVRVGAAWDARQDLTLASDVILNPDETEGLTSSAKPQFGAEWRRGFDHARSLAVRAGWKDSGPTFGAGLQFRVNQLRVALNYAFLLDEVAPSGSHSIAWVFEL